MFVAFSSFRLNKMPLSPSSGTEHVARLAPLAALVSLILLPSLTAIAQPSAEEQIRKIEELHAGGRSSRGYDSTGEDVKGREAWFHFVRSFPYGEIPAGARPAAMAQANALTERLTRSLRSSGREPRLFAASQWEPIGPSNQGGRIRGLTAHPTNKGIFYAGAAAGGVWKTIDTGRTWTPMFDRESAIAVGSLAIDPRNPDVIYAGTGENFPSSQNLLTNTPSYLGNGVYKSTDAGLTWSNVGLGTVGAVSKLAVHPQNSNIVYAAGAKQNGGFYRSTDAGATWNRSIGTILYDMSVNPQNGEEIFVGSSGAVLRSVDGGRFFSQATTGMNTTSGIRVSVALAPSLPTRVYALIARGGESNEIAEVYVSTNSGGTWALSKSMGASFFNNQGVYDNCIIVSPTDPNFVFAGGIDVYRTLDGGVNWWNSTRVYSGGDVHPDQHVMVFHPAATEFLILGNDGGVYTTDSRGSSWTNRSFGLGVTQFYRMEVDQTREFRVYGGTQDNGTSGSFGTTGFTGSWTRVLGGDGFFVSEDKSDPNWFYAELYYGDLYRINANNPAQKTSVDAGIPSGQNGDPGNWATPIAMSSADQRSLYSGRSFLWRTTNSGGAWTRLDPQLGSKHSAIGLSLADPNDLVVGAINGAVRYSTDYGATWAASQGTPSATVTDIRFDPAEDNRVYMTVSGFGSRHVFRSETGGATFADITANLPNIPCNAIEIDPIDNARLFVATDIGVFFSPNGGEFWIPFNEGMALAPVSDLRIHYTSHYLVASTHGRSMFRVSLNSLEVQPALVFPAGGEQVTTPGTLRVQWYGISRPVNVSIRYSSSEPWRLVASSVAGSSTEIALDARRSTDAAVKVEEVGGGTVLVSGPFMLLPIANVAAMGRRGGVAEAIDFRGRDYFATIRDSDTVYRIRLPLFSLIDTLQTEISGAIRDLAYDRNSDAFYALVGGAGLGEPRIYRLDTLMQLLGEITVPAAARGAVGITVNRGSLVIGTEAPDPRFIGLDPLTGQVRFDIPVDNAGAERRVGLATSGEAYLQGVIRTAEPGRIVSEIHVIREGDTATLETRVPVVTPNADPIMLVGLAFESTGGERTQTVYVTDTAGIVYRFGTETFARVEEESAAAADAAITMSSPVPNPASSGFVVTLSTSRPCDFTLSVVDASGVVLRKERHANHEAGVHRLEIDLRGIPSGVYYVVGEDGLGARSVRPLAVVK